jgi:dihydroorotase
MDYLLRSGRVVDASGNAGKGLDAERDILVRDGRIAEVGTGLALPAGVREIDAAGKLVLPGLVDVHVHLREPGQEYKEDIESGSRGAAAGGVTTMCCMPNTRPVNDCRAVTDLIVRRAREAGLARVFPIGAVSKGLQGKSLAEFGEMKEAGIVAVSDDGRPIMDAGLMRRALEYGKTFDLPVIQHAEDLSLAEGGVMNEGEVATRAGLRGQPPQAESVMVARDIELVEWTGAQYHVAHASTGRTMELVRDAKRRGLPVSCEVAPHHFTLTDEACSTYNTDMKVAPPLRNERDRLALIEAIADGTVDCIATDHAPHSEVEKDVEFDCASCGMLGLETLLSLSLGLVSDGVISLPRMVELLTSAPARLFKLQSGIGSLAIGCPADLIIVDREARWTVDREKTQSKSKNTPFHGREVQGKVLLTLLAGTPVFDPKGLCQ